MGSFAFEHCDEGLDELGVELAVLAAWRSSAIASSGVIGEP